MGSEWIECTLGDYLTFKNGKSSPEREAAAEKPVYGANGVIGFSDQVNTQSQSLVIGRVGTYCGSVYHTSSDCWVTDNAISCVPKISGESEFWYFKLLALHLNSHRTGSGQPLLNQGILNSISTGIPKEHSVRYSIGKFLMDFDNKIALNRQINTTLESMAQALFKSWFVDFDPVIDNALAAGNEIPDELAARAARREALRQQTNKTTETTNAASSEQALPETGLSDQRLPSQIQQLFPDRFVLTEEMGWVPEGWEVSQLSSQIDVLNGFAFKSGDYSESGIFVLRTKNFNSDSMVDLLPDDVFLPDEFKVSHNKYLCESFDYHLIMVGASVGNRGMIMPHQLPALRNQNMWCFRPTNTGIVSRVFTKHLLDTLIVEKMGLASGSAREFFRKGDFQSHWMVVGSKKIQEAFEAIAQAYLSKQAINLAQADYLADLRDSLLPKLLSGQITIPDAEQQLAEVL
jgi:type I restriction enzyme S subunit